MKVKEFKSTEEFENYFETERYNELKPIVVMEKGYCKADFTTYCKSWRTAIRRAKKAFFSYAEIVEQLEGIEGSCENGYFSLSEKYNGNYIGGWFYGVEEVSEGIWYIYLSFVYDIDIAEKYRKNRKC